MPDIISNNPFRILGVCANASPREIVSNKNKMNAFLKVNRPVEFPLDLSQLLGNPVRTQETVTAADSALTDKDDRRRAAQFWWLNGSTPLDEAAFRHIAAGDLDAALAVWEKDRNMSSLANASVAHLIKGNIRPAVVAASRLYESFAEDFARAVDVPSATRAELVEGYVSSVTEGWPQTDLDLLFGQDFPDWWNTDVRSALVDPIVAQLNDALQACRKAKGQGYQKRFNAGIQLDTVSAPLFRKLRKVVKINDVALVNISDKIANEILQCSIDAYNDCDNPPAFAPEALKLLLKAKRVALGSVTKQRIKENEAVLRDNIASLPPAEVATESAQLDALMNRYANMTHTVDSARRLLNEAEPILSSMGRLLPPDRQDYLVNRSSAVANLALNILIDHVNGAQQGLQQGMSKETFLYIRGVVDDARRVTLSLQGLKLNPETQDRVNQNVKAITDISIQLNEVQTEPTLGDKIGNAFSGCWIYIAIIVIFNLIGQCF